VRVIFRDAENVEEDTDDVRTLRERRPNASNRTELLQLMDNTREERRQWIVDKSPSITDILQRYPRFQDIDTAVSIKRENRSNERICRPSEELRKKV